MNVCKELGVPAPEYSIVGEDIMVKFTAHDSIFYDTINENDRENDRDDVNLTAAENRIFKEIIQNPQITTNQLCKKASVSSSTVSRSTRRLKELGYIQRIGSDRDGYWEIIIK